MHRFRIRGKKLRYAMELLVTAFPGSFRTKVYPVIEELQETLGQVNDHVTAVGRITRWIDEADDAQEIDYLQSMLISEEQELDRTHRELLSWWTPATGRTAA